MSGDSSFDEDLMLMDSSSTVMRGAENLISALTMTSSSSAPLPPETVPPPPGPSALPAFDALDYTVFCVMLALSALIGVYFAFFAKQKQNTTAEYLMGGKNMGIVPVSLSLIAR